MHYERSFSLIGAIVSTLLLLGCEPKEEGPPDLVLSTTSIDFGAVGFGELSALPLTLTNQGGGTVEILSISLVDGDDDVFTVDGDVATLSAGASGTVNINCEPDDEEGTEEGQLQVRSTDEDEPQLYVDLSCTSAPSTRDGDGDGYSPATGDCDDANASAFPGNPEVCDGVDNDCSGAADADEADADYDGWRLCEEDCDDGDAYVYPGAEELCDDKDTDCDGQETDREDQDGDGYTVCDGDCDETEPDAWPGNVEVCDDVDNDCSGYEDDLDVDGDGHSPCGAAGDCDDDDASAYPVVLDAAAADGGDGTERLPFNDLDDAIAGLDEVCRTVIFAPGTYTVGLEWTGDPLVLSGGGDDASEVVLTAEAGARVAEVTGGGALTLQNLTVQGGTADGDGGALWASLSDLTLIDVIASGNTSTGDGGAVAVNAGTLTLSGCTFSDNVAVDDGGAIAVVSGSFVDEGSWYEGNSGVRGGAVLLEGAGADVDGSSFWSNLASQEGGGIALAGAGPVELRRSTFALNQAGTLGGALSFTDVDDPSGEVSNLFVQDNEAAVAGGGVAVTGDVVAFTFGNNTLTGNVASGDGGGLYIDADDASDLYVWSNLVIASYGESGLYVASGSDASVGWCTAYLTSSGVEFGGEVEADSDENTEENPLFTSFTNDGDPTDDDLSLKSSSPARNSGPDSAAWEDTDGTQNDRGATGGPEASP